MGLPGEGTGLLRKAGFGSGHHSEKELGFFRFCYAPTYGVEKILPRHGFIGLAVVGPNAGGGSNKLIDKPVVGWVPGDRTRKAHDLLAKKSRPLFEVPGFGRRIT